VILSYTKLQTGDPRETTLQTSYSSRYNTSDR